jgi:hypothetical protein
LIRADLVDHKDEVDFVAQLPEYAVKLSRVHTIPSDTWFRERVELTDEDEDGLRAIRESLLGDMSGECSRLLGWPDSVQSEVVEGADEIVILQLNGSGFSAKGIEKVFQQLSHRPGRARIPSLREIRVRRGIEVFATHLFGGVLIGRRLHAIRIRRARP